MSKEEGQAVAGAFWSNSPVVAITSTWRGKPNGQIAVTAVTSSIVHFVPRLLVGIWKGNYTHEFIVNSGAFAIHLLRPNGMGTTFKILIQHKGLSQPDLDGLRYKPFFHSALTAQSAA